MGPLYIAQEFSAFGAALPVLSLAASGRHQDRCCPLADAPVMVEFRAPMSPQQRQWLRTTRLRMRRVAFHVDDAASAALLRARQRWCMIG